MATTTTKKQAAEAVSAPVRVSPNKRLIVIALIVLVAAAAAAAVTWALMARSHHNSGSPEAFVPPTPVFLPLDPMTINLLSDDGQQHYLRIGLTLKLTDPTIQQQLIDHMPEIRSRILLALSNKHPEDLAPLDGKRVLAGELKSLIEKPTDKGLPPVAIEDVLLTELVVQ